MSHFYYCYSLLSGLSASIHLACTQIFLKFIRCPGFFFYYESSIIPLYSDFWSLVLSYYLKSCCSSTQNSPITSTFPLLKKKIVPQRCIQLPLLFCLIPFPITVLLLTPRQSHWPPRHCSKMLDLLSPRAFALPHSTAFVTTHHTTWFLSIYSLYVYTSRLVLRLWPHILKIWGKI